MKKLIIPIVAVAMAIGSSAFTAKKTSGYFYHYTSASTAQADIQNINNYARLDATCPDGSNVCGVYLATNRSVGQVPVATEFNAEKSSLWSSQQNGAAADGNISMKN